jgi:hypothetical protein
MNKSLEKAAAEQMNTLYVQQYRLILEHVPRWQRFLMEWSPFWRRYFDYSITLMDGDPTKLTLVRSTGGKVLVIARNFDLDEYLKQKGLCPTTEKR